MNARNPLDRYLDQIRGRLQAVIVARAAAAAAAVALVITCAAVWITQQEGFPSVAVNAARIVLAVALLIIAAVLLWRPLRRLRLQDGARELEKHLPAQGGRIETYLDLLRKRQKGQDEPMLDLLAEDAVTVAEQSPPERVVPAQRTWVPAAVAALAVLALGGLMTAGSYWGFGTRHLLLGASLPVESVVARRILVKPGDATVRKNQDLPIHAAVQGFDPAKATVHVRFGQSGKWESAPMRAGREGQFEFTLFALREPVSYFVTAGNTRSAEHRIDVAEVPRIARMRLTYIYPEWTGLKPHTEDAVRDIEAVAGTKVQLEVQTTAPVESPTLIVNGSDAPLKSEGNRSRGELVVKSEGTYRVSALVGDELVPLTDDHSITLVPDEKPTIEVAKPGRDWRATSIEEVPVRIRAEDDFRVQGLELRYAVNGGEWQSVPLNARSKDVNTEALLRLEELGASQPASLKSNAPRLTPGDLVTYYAVARDRRQSAQTDLFLIHVQPFDRRFTQGQAGMQGGGAGGEQENAISERQREILLATWNLQRTREDSGTRGAQRVEDNARMLAELQSTLADQARTLSERARARMLTGADEQIRKFVENLELAVQAMQPAAQRLGEVRLKEAIPSEQKALQHLMRAEALFTEIQVAFQQGGAGGGHAGRDLAEMFELEMDMEKNQYETESPVSAESSPKDIDETIRKLRELAQRQERLAREAENNPARTPEQQKWRQEQLRREAEDLRRRLAEMARQGGGQTPAKDGQGSESSGSSASQALSDVEKALENMKNAANGSQGQGQGQGSGQSSSDTRSAREASRNLKQALDRIQQGRRDGLAGTFDDFAQRARQLREQQQRSEQELQQALQGGRQPGSAGAERYGGIDPERAQALADEKRAMQAQLQALERDMRTAAQRHRKDAPRSSKEIGAAADELSQSNAGGRLGRSAMDLERGRMLEAATREGLITEALQALESDVGQAAQVAANEARDSNGDEAATPDELLAELAELRRAWQQAQAQSQTQGGQGSRGDRRGQGRQDRPAQGQGDQPGQGKGSQPGQGKGDQRGQQAGPGEGNGKPGEAGTWGANGSIGEPGVLQDGNPSHYSGGWSGGLKEWNPSLAPYANRRVDSPEFREQAAQIARRLKELQNRLPRGALPQTDTAALRQLAERLRGGGDPMVGQYNSMMDLVDQLELAVLKASERNGTRPPTRSTVPVPDSPRYRENVAEYYRKLGEEGSARR